MDYLMIMGILQGCRYLFDVRHSCLEREARATRVTLEDSPARRIVHDKKGRPLLHGKVEDAHNLGMLQTGERLRLREEVLHLFVFERGVQDFERGTAFEKDVLAEIDLSEAAVPKQAQETVVAQLLTNAI